MSKLVSAQLRELRQKFRQFEHGGHCFGSEEITSVVREIGQIAAAAAAIEDRVAGVTAGQIPSFPMPAMPRPPVPPRPRPQPGAVPIGTFYFVPHDDARPGGAA